MKQQQGFTLIEALIALVVLSIGLVGLAGLLVQGMKFNHGAYVRTQAMLLSYDMADRILANREGLDAGVYNNIPVTGQETTPVCNPGTDNCAPDQMAAFDFFTWGNLLSTVLPQNTGITPAPTIGSVTADANGSVYTITVNWMEIDPNDPDPNANATTGAVTKTFAMSFQP